MQPYKITIKVEKVKKPKQLLRDSSGRFASKKPQPPFVQALYVPDNELKLAVELLNRKDLETLYLKTIDHLKSHFRLCK